MDFRSVIFGCSTTTLTSTEVDFFRSIRPWGFILFSRNIESPDQVRSLCDSLRSTIDSPTAPILIDQEGGRVSRLGPPHWNSYPSAYSLGCHYSSRPGECSRAVWLLSRLLAFDLSSLGINVDCLPVLDLRHPDAHDVIGDRSYGASADTVISLGRVACDGLKSGGVLPVIKHIPGHGRSLLDSHESLPRISTSHSDLSSTDFLPFSALCDEPMAMTAHIIYESLDSDSPATTSSIIINDIIRGELGYDNLLMSDDISMNALSGDYASRTKAVFSAGCDILLHCNGDMSEMREIADSSPILSGKSLERALNALATCTGFADKSDELVLRSEFDSLMIRLQEAI